MPTYDYDCAGCGGFEAFRSIAKRDEPCDCPACGSVAARVMSAPRLELLADSTRLAMETNERAAHQPKRSADGYGRMRHPAGCGCCSTAKRNSATVTGANGQKAFPTKRPWMISH